MPPQMDENQFAKFFIMLNKENIKRDLKIKYPNIDIIIKTVYEFLIKNKDISKKHYDSWYNKELYTKIVNYLISAQKNGTHFEMTIEQYVDYLTEKLRKCTYVE